MGYIRRVQAVLAEKAGEKMLANKLARAAGIPIEQFQRAAGDLVKGGHISRVKLKGSISGHYWYYLNPDQLRVYRLRMAIAQTQNPDEVDLVIDTMDIPDRLAFLRMLKEKTVFADHAALNLIIADYERTLTLRKAQVKELDSPPVAGGFRVGARTC